MLFRGLHHQPQGGENYSYLSFTIIDVYLEQLCVFVLKISDLDASSFIL